MKFRSPTAQPLHVALTTGHTCVVPPEGAEIDQIFHREAISRGAIPGSITEDEKPVLATGFDRKALIAGAMNAMLEGANEEDFNKDGKPNLREVNARIGFQASREEVDAVWAEVSKNLDAGGEKTEGGATGA
ncbi:hypothetical protein LJR066_002839 [Acidovorax sp. LjRoot66]|uniref:hypothetical protein n=1 Tax=Acidovorax sp. LjRoot66 TaxID=3342334 RepID=UPI003ECD5AC8